MIGLGDIFQRFLRRAGPRQTPLASWLYAPASSESRRPALLLRVWGAYGAVASSIFAGATYLGLMIAIYIRRSCSIDRHRADELRAESNRIC